MKRIVSLFQWDLLISTRYGLFVVAGFVLLVWVAVLTALPVGIRPFLAPVILFADLPVFGFYFMAALILFDKGQMTLDALVVTPVTSKEYILSKALILVVLSVCAGILIVLISGTRLESMLLLSVALSLNSFLFALLGIVSVAQYKSLSDYFVPSIGYVTVLTLPIIEYFSDFYLPTGAQWTRWLWFIIPSHSGMVLLESAFSKTGLFSLTLSLTVLTGWIGVAYLFAQREFDRNIRNIRGV